MALDLSGPKNAPPPASKPRPRGNTTRADSGKLAEERTSDRAEGIAGLGQLACIPLMLLGQHADVGAIQAHWPAVSTETAKIADNNPKLAAVIDKAIAIGPYAGLVTALMPFVLQILVNHNRLSMHPMLGGMGVISPQAMEMRAQAEMMRQAAESMRAQQTAEQEVRELMQEAERNLADVTGE